MNTSQLLRRTALMVGLLGASTSLLGYAQNEMPSPSATPSPAAAPDDALPGSLLVARDGAGARLGVCPLEKTEVSAQLGPQVGQTTVRQVFGNPYSVPIEALYSFALPENAAVSGLTLRIGERKIVGQIQTRDRARQIYDAAKRAGKVAVLLDQKRPNSFSQAIANIAPGQKISVEISYSQSVAWRDGDYEWTFPLTTGPRFAPSRFAPSTSPGTPAPNPTLGTDATSALPPGSASFEIHIAAGLPLQSVESPSHSIAVTQGSDGEARVSLQGGAVVPDRDFVLRYRTATDSISQALVTHSDAGGTYFSLSLQPPARVAPGSVRPKELVWVLDRSGSMAGFPLEAAKKLINKNLDALHRGDTFNVWSFSFGPEAVFERPVAPTPENIAIAKRYLESLDARGPTDMLPIVRAALHAPADGKRLRVVTFITDGYVDNDMEIIAAAQASARSTRVCAFGVGSAVNRYLLDGLALAGRGESDYLVSPAETDKVADRFTKELDAPVLTDISLDWGTLPVAEVFPRAMPDLFAARPLSITGRFTSNASGVLTVRGRTANGPYERKIPISSPKPTQNPAIASLWAKAKVAEILSHDLVGLQYDNFNASLKKQVEKLGLNFDLLTPFTSFVAVDSQVNVPAKTATRRVEVPSAKPADSGARPSPYTGESGARSAAGDGRYAATSRGDFTGAAGDPLLRVEAPGAARVVALLPDGRVANLRWNSASHAWEAHFDIPTYAPDGFYRVQIITVASDGTRHQSALRFSVDNRAPHALGALRREAGFWQIAVEADESTDRAFALAPWGEKLALQRDGLAWSGKLNVPQSWSGDRRVAVVLTDHAHNRTTISVDESR